MTKLELRLYVAGMTPQSRRVIENLTRICEAELKGLCDIEVVDVLEPRSELLGLDPIDHRGSPTS